MKRLLAAVGFLACAALRAQLPDAEHISVTGAATLTVMPDTVTIETQVQAKDKNAAKAKAIVDERSAKTLALTKMMGIAEQDVTASQITICGDYDYDKNADTGTIVRRDIIVVLRDLSKYADLVQGLAEVPVSSIGDTTMGFSKNDRVQAEALAKAVADARAKAGTLAEQFGAELGDVYSIYDQGGYPSPAGMNSMGVTLDRLAPEKETFRPGPISVTARIHAVFRIKPKK